MTIYLIEDEVEIRQELASLLERYGYHAAFSEDFVTVIEDVKKCSPDLVLLDVNLPYKDGYTICRELREQMSVPIIMLTAQNSEMEEVMSLKSGADDFVSKPYHPQVLLAHIEVVLKRAGAAHTKQVLNYRGLALYLLSGIMKYEGKQIELTRNELKILSLLMEQPGVIVSRDEMMEVLWQDGQFVDENTLNVNIVRLRKKLLELGLSINRQPLFLIFENQKR